MFHYCVFRTNVERSTPLATVRFVESFFIALGVTCYATAVVDVARAKTV